MNTNLAEPCITSKKQDQFGDGMIVVCTAAGL
jgi:hypothetical protein